ncbi:superinfection immunity protein [Achromobacter deleyi]|uniref:superinfection immunity protein n=1 Tax=Achromobacter deleyi TaxID=1353891 RepID=UPI001467DBB0|nr:superinfection immunity protein [Achromobacter deleyi]CAB3922614.1 hypothetical protein LMG3412_05444 [Achromobacter deleyi]
MPLEQSNQNDMIERQAAARRRQLGQSTWAEATQPPPDVNGVWTGVRIVALAFWVFYAWSMGQQLGPLNSVGKLIAGSFFLATPLLYVLPLIEAKLRRRTNFASIAIVNIFLGWTFIGWVVALAWACSSKPTNTEPRIQSVGPSPVRPASAAVTAAPKTSVADEIQKLANLRADGLITDDEFNTQKAKLLL